MPRYEEGLFVKKIICLLHYEVINRKQKSVKISTFLETLTCLQEKIQAQRMNTDITIRNLSAIISEKK